MPGKSNISRRGFGVSALALAAAPAASRAAPRVDPLAGEALYRDVQAYSGLGDHRTGTTGDRATTAWLMKSLRAAGYTAIQQDFDFPVFDLEACRVEVEGRRIAAFPLWPPVATPAGGATGRISETPGPGDIALVRLPYDPRATVTLPRYATPLKAAMASPAAAVVAITDNPVGEMMALNTPPEGPAWAKPLVIVAAREARALAGAAAAGRSATVILAGRSVPGSASNVIARRGAAGKHLVLSTPKSGWFRCAGERGSGMAIWLGLARWLASTPHNITLITTSGHEFEGFGGRKALAAYAPKPEDTKLWLHIGANVAAYDFALKDGRVTRLATPTVDRGIACSEALVPLAREAFRGQPGYDRGLDIDKERPPGEVALYQRMGYKPIIGLVGAHPLHHTPRDLPDVTSPAMLEPVAKSLRMMLEKI